MKALVAKGIEQRHLLLLYQSVVLSATDYRLGLTTMALLTKSAKAGQSAERGNGSYTGNPQGTHPLRP